MKRVLARPGDTEDARIDQALVKAVVFGRDWFEQLSTGQDGSFAEVARAEAVAGRYAAHVIPLAFPALDIVASTLSSTQPVDLTAQKLINREPSREVSTWADSMAVGRNRAFVLGALPWSVDRNRSPRPAESFPGTDYG